MDPTDLAFAGLARQAELVRSRAVSSRELVELCLERIDRLDPRLRAFRVVLAESALAAADEADRAQPTDARPLHGVPVAIKDDTDVAGEVTAHGLLDPGEPAGADAPAVANLRAAGAVIVGKTHVPELEALAATESLAFGATRNPWDPARTPGGSSGGSGAAVAAGLVPAALGTDGAGSIRIPAACCGLYGLKPQRGRVPMRDGWNGLAAAGALTRSVLDTAVFDDAAAPGAGFTAAAGRDPGELRVAWSVRLPRGVVTSVEAEQRAAVTATADRLRALGHRVEERDPDYGAAALNVATRYLHGIRTEAEALPHPERLSRRTRGLVTMGRAIPSALVARALAQEDADRERTGALLRDFDVLLTPTLTRRPPPIGEWEGLPAPVALSGMANFTAFLGLWNHTGQPAAALPVVHAPDGMPVSVQLVGRPGDEATLLALSAQLERDTDWLARRPTLAA